MKKTWLTAKELAALLQVSIKTVRRAYRNGEIPMVRFRKMVRFDLEQVTTGRAAGGSSSKFESGRRSRATRDRRPRPAARTENAPVR